MNIMQRFLSKLLIRPNLLQLDASKKYILLLDTPVDQATEAAFLKAMSGFDIVLMTGAKGQLLELDLE
jgi:hypothetical protein